MTPLPLPSQTLAWLIHAADAGQCDAQALLHLIARADEHDQDVAAFVDSYSKTIAALCRRLEALERGAKDLPTAPVDDSPVADALREAEAALTDVAEREAVSPHAVGCLHWAEARCTEALAAIRPVMRQHGIRTSEFPTAAPGPAAPTPSPVAPAGGPLESIASPVIVTKGRGSESFQGISKDAIREVAAWLDTRGQHGCSYLLREEIIDQ
jgi:hypothetical protein